MEKIIILFAPGKEETSLELERLKVNENIIPAINLKSMPCKIKRAIRRLHLYSPLPGISIWLGDWKYMLPETKQVICIANNYSYRILKWIKSKYPNIRCINYYWDEVLTSGYPVLCSKNIENWSFCRYDCEKYGMRYNSQFLLDYVPLEKFPIEYDVVFVGADRNGRWTSRDIVIEECISLFDRIGLSYYIWFYSKSDKVSSRIKRDRYLNDQEYRIVNAKAKAVLEIVDSDHPWETLRPLFALYNEKKLITNNHLIRKEKYYLKDNIFILGYDSEDELKEFINNPFKKIPNEVFKYYEPSEWIKRFT